MTLHYRAWIGAALAALFAASANAGVYKWVDKDGNVKYSDRPPPDQPVEEVNRSAVPMALQERLRKMDPDFTIKRISGNLGNASVCLELNVNQRSEPAFVTAFRSARLGDIQQAAQQQNGYQTDYDYDENGYPHPRTTGKKVDDRCPAQRNDRYRPEISNTVMRIYEITFDPKAVSAYRSAQ